MTTTTSPAPQLSSRLLRLALLWVIILIASVVYTLFLSGHMETAADVVRRVGAVRADLFQISYSLTTPRTTQSGVDIQGAVWRIDRSLNLAMVVEDSPYRIMAKDARVDGALQNIDQTWRQSVKPRLLRWHESPGAMSEQDRKQTLDTIRTLNVQLDQWQQLTDADASRTLVVLRYTQIALGLLSVLSVIVVMWFLVGSVIRPLNQLQEGLERLKESDWKTRVHAEGTQEFSDISAGFNNLASRLDDVYTNLENKVEEKTASLSEKNTYLTTLYGMTAFLGEQHTLEELLESFLARAMSLTDARAGDIRFYDESRESIEVVFSKSVEPVDEKSAQSNRYWFKALQSPYPNVVRREDTADTFVLKETSFTTASIYHIRHKQKNIGLFVLYFDGEREFESGIDTLLQNLGRHLGAAVENMRLAELDQQMAVAQERNILAQNLHDSIAQTLSFVNLQVQMLEDAIKHNNQEQTNDGIVQIKAGVQECYDDVRELLLNFRARVYTDALDEIVKSVLERFERQTHVKTHLSFHDEGAALSSTQKLQIIFILQEALSNVRKHAQAQTVMVTVRNAEDFEMSVMDDGVGIDPQLLEERKQSHVGLSIMRERAQRIQANITIESEPGQGTTVRFTLPHEVRQRI